MLDEKKYIEGSQFVHLEVSLIVTYAVICMHGLIVYGKLLVSI